MASDHIILRHNENFKGIDNRSSDLSRSKEYATDLLNVAFRKTGAINKRKGFKINVSEETTFYGGSSLSSVNPFNGAVSQELVAVDKSHLYKLADTPINFSYDGVSDLYVSLISKGTNFYFEVKNQDVVVYDKNLGTGLDTNSVTVSTLVNELNTLVYFPVSIIPNHTYVTDLTQSGDSVSTFQINLPYSYVKNVLMLTIGQELKINNETTMLTITDININKDLQEEITSYDITLQGTSWTLSNLNSYNQGIQLNLNEFYDLVVTNTNPDIDSLPASLMDLIVNKIVPSSTVGGVDIFIKKWNPIDHGDSFIKNNDFLNYISWNIDNSNVLISDELENASFAQINNVMYVSNGYEDLLKYDGEYVYSAGLPNVNKDIFNITEHVGSGASTHDITDPKIDFKIVYEYTDFKGNVISSQPSDTTTINLSTGSAYVFDISWNIDDLIGSVNSQSQQRTLGELSNRDLSGQFNNEETDANGNITKTKHPSYDSLKEDTDAEWDTNMTPARGQKRLRIKIYRSKVYPGDGVVGQYYLVANIPYDYQNDQQDTEIRDAKTDDDLNPFLALVEPIKRHDPPPKGKYLSIFKNCLVTAGDPTNVNNVRYSLPNNASTGEIGSEYFPDDENGIVVDSPFGDKITAIAPLRDLLYVFHSNSISVIGGNINLLELPISDLLTREGGVGCLSHHSIQEVQNSLIFLSSKGMFSIDATNAVKEISSLVSNLFNDNTLSKKRTSSVNWTTEDLILIQIPKEDVVNNSEYQLRYTTGESLILIYDYYRDAWLKWDNIEMSSLSTMYKNNLYFMNRSLNGSFLYAMSNSGTQYDFSDHTDPIVFYYETNWESLGEPTVPKKFLRLKMYSFDTDSSFESPGFSLQASFQKDYNPNELGSLTLDFAKDNAQGWGGSAWGQFGWGNSPRTFIKTKLMSSKARSLKLVLYNDTINENVLVTNYEYEIANTYRTEIKE